MDYLEVNNTGRDEDIANVKGFIYDHYISDDEFTFYVSRLRENAKKEKLKKEIVDFICTEDFKFFYEKGKDRKVFSMFFDECITQNIYDIK